MKKNKYLRYFLATIILVSCVDSIDYSSINFKSNLIVKAIITDEFKNHTVELSKSVPIDSEEIIKEINAVVKIKDDSGNIYDFNETEQGIYTSISPFKAEPNQSYTLEIQTSNGEKYSSSSQQLPTLANINNLTPSIDNNLDNNKVIVLTLDASGNSANGSYYRYEYDETYQIRPVVWNPKRIEVVSDTPPYAFKIVEKEPEIYGNGFCYGNNKSKKILLAETTSLSSDEVKGYKIREIPVSSYVLGIRYSILIKQYVLNQNTNNYYQLLDKFSNNDNIFTQTQVGNIPSNITSETNPIEDKVIGYFEVSSLTKKRFYFNREDITNLSFVNYLGLTGCNEFPNPPLEDDSGGSPLLEYLQTHILYDEPPGGIGGGSDAPYELILRECGDCSQAGSVIKPDFWED
ncbi:hypothetical protein BTO06_05470 [Tenacibaculum sp. SZ-18]|uniref:DUF4249 domain-containing protein n=1 Tax=Tenacibaculum sp. SZ-18 TaxID=754423 RepID=UPI000C2D23C7|nr:DUF4249 domain-containing protein [Tenacibaculum sp. SZ-18]AUC14620.1 hypothetical protein BTO06_05470 [Tenacibaculum sp. SZ-18]